MAVLKYGDFIAGGERQPNSTASLLQLRNSARHMTSESTNCKRSAQLPVRIMHDGNFRRRGHCQLIALRHALSDQDFVIHDRCCLCDATWTSFTLKIEIVLYTGKYYNYKLHENTMSNHANKKYTQSARKYMRTYSETQDINSIRFTSQ